MKSTYCAAAVAALAVAGAAQQSYNDSGSPPVGQFSIEDTITTEALSAKALELQEAAYSTPDRNRVMSSEGHNNTIQWIKGYLDSMSDYYSYEIQPFIALYSNGNATLTVNGEDQDVEILEYAPAGEIEAEIVAVDNLGCEAGDYPDAVADAIALISRGECEFGLKSALAGAAGAAAAIIYNNEPGPIGSATLGPPPRPEGEYIPTVSISQENGTAILDLLEGGEEVTGVVEVVSDIRNVTTYNVIAETLTGDHNTVVTLGAHSDSVFAGPGINDDGSGTIGILETAIQLSKYSVNNAVRFCWWSGEEFGLLGSTHYVESLSSAELAKIRLYLNFDMIASPNYIFATFDGDGSAFNLTGPPGSAQIEAFFESWFADRDVGLVPTAFDGRSDYQAFADNGVASGGLFTGADDTKTEEEVALFGGTAGITHDPNYHSAQDNYDNLNFTAFTTMTKAIAASVAEYATSVADLPAGNNTMLARRRASRPLKRRTTDLRKVVKGHYEAWIV